MAGLDGTLDQSLGLALVFKNSLLAVAYLSQQYLLMIGFDIGCRHKKEGYLRDEIETNDFPEDSVIWKTILEKRKKQEEEQIYQY